VNENDQADGETRTESQPEADTDDKSLDELLSEFEVNPPEPEKPQKPDPDIAERLAALEAVEAQRSYKAGIEGAVQSLKADEFVGKFTDRAVNGFLHALAADNPKFRQSWEQRGQSPDAWRQSLSWAKKEFRKDFRLPDDQLTSDIEAAQASVRGMSNEPPGPDKPAMPSPSELGMMSDADFKRLKQKMGAKTR